jgi:hypothetical protein
MNFIEENLVDTDDDVIAFVDSDEFARFEKIMKRLYLEKLNEFHRTTPDKLEPIRANLSCLLNLSTIMIGIKTSIIENRRREREKE